MTRLAGGKLPELKRIAPVKPMNCERLPRALVSVCIAFTLNVLITNAYGQTGGNSSNPSAKTNGASDDPAGARLAHGKKLVLKDGNFQLVGSYERKGERVRYFSVERNAWEEIPAALIDWEATEKARVDEEKAEAALVKRVAAQEQAHNIVSVVDVDASLPVGSGVFLPSGEGMFVVAGKSVTRLEQVGSQTRADKKRAIEKVLSPLPIVPSKHYVEIPGGKARFRVHTFGELPEFYLREAAPDPDNPTAIWQSSRQGLEGPEVELVRAEVKGDKRRLKAIRSLMGQEISAEMNTIVIQRWEIAKNVYRFTISEPLPPGEYALAEILPDGMNVFVWDFGVDAPRKQ
jgi:hypothetical protein